MQVLGKNDGIFNFFTKKITNIAINQKKIITTHSDKLSVESG